MAVTLPKIDITFKQLAGSLIERSERGIAVLILRDDTITIPTVTKYTDITQVDEDKENYTATNLQYLKDIMQWGVYQLITIRIAMESTASDGLKLVEKATKTGWITIADGTTEDFATLASWIKTKENERKTYKAVCYKAAVTDCMHIVNFYNEKVTFQDERGEQPGAAYCPSLIGILAASNVKRGVTYFKCADLKTVEELDDNQAAVSSGKFVLMNDLDEVLICLGINSMTTTNGSTLTEDMKYIETVEAMDMIRDDITRVFREEYLGAYKNKYQNQILFISAVNDYFKQLTRIDVLDDEYNNHADIDVEAQRQAWIGTGKTEAEEWEETEVRNNTFKRDIFLAGDIKILNSMTNLLFNISMM